jgi:hypothetical protein
VFYQSGVGTENNLVDKVLGGLTGAGLGTPNSAHFSSIVSNFFHEYLVEKVQEAYGFLAQWVLQSAWKKDGVLTIDPL